MHSILCVTACDVVTNVVESFAPSRVCLYWRLVKVLQPQLRVSKRGQKKVVHSINSRFW